MKRRSGEKIDGHGFVLEVSRRIDMQRRGAGLGDADVLQFSQPLVEADCRLLAALLTDHPTVTLRAYGADDDLATPRLLRWFPCLRRFSIAGLQQLTDLASLQQLSPVAGLGETRTPLDLTRWLTLMPRVVRRDGKMRTLPPFRARSRPYSPCGSA